MVTTKEQGALLHIISHCLRIEEKTKGLAKDAFDASDDIKDIVCFNLFQIGELAKSFSQEFILKHKEVPWNQIKGMRDRIGHGYGTISMERVWQTVVEDVRPLREYCERILAAEAK